MAIRDILLFPHDALITPGEDVPEVDDEVRALIEDLKDTMYDAPGIGLAAPQIGVSKRVAVVDISPRDETGELLVLVNPRVVERKGKITWEEGCLSFPGLYEKIDRAHDVVVEALDENGQPFTIEASELLAVCLQHEIDHLDGIVFTERMSHLKKRRAMKKYKKILDGLKAEEEAGESEDEE